MDDQGREQTDTRVAAQPDRERDSDGDTERSADTGSSDHAPEEQGDAQHQRSAEEFAREHDPAQHDVAAGADARQPGDWTADEAGGPQVWDADGKLVEGDAPGLQSSQRAAGSEGSDGSDGSTGSQGSGSGRRTSSLEEVRDGGYGVGSAATIDDAVPLGHPVKAWEDTKTYVAPGHDHYDAAEPHVWFTDGGAAERAGFRHIQ